MAGFRKQPPSQDFIVCMEVTQEDLDMFARLNSHMQEEFKKAGGNVSLAMKFTLWYKGFIHEIGAR